MRKPHALTTALGQPQRRLALPTAPPAWQSTHAAPGPSPPTAPPSTAASESRPPFSLHGASSEPQAAQPLAPHLFRLLQLQLRTSLLQLSAPQPPPLTTQRSSSGASQDEGALHLLRRLRSEMSGLGNVLIAHSQIQQSVDSVGASEERRTSHTSSNATSASRSGSGKGGERRAMKDSRAPVQLLPVPSSEERAWLQPLQLDVVRQMLAHLTVAERLSVALVHGALRPSTHSSAAVAPASAALHTELALFFQQCTRVVATLVALRADSESDAVPLACLTHMWRASAAAGVPVTVPALLAAVEGVRQEEKPWCSCVPWMLHRYAITHAPAAASEDLQHTTTGWSEASAWMTTAADRVCATEGVDLLEISPSRTQRGRAAAPLVPGVQPQGMEPALFGPWQALLDEEAKTASTDCAGGIEVSAPTSGQHNTAVSTELWSWLTDRSTQASEESNDAFVTGGLRPYWRAVVRELLRSGARAVEVLQGSFADAQGASHRSPAREQRGSANTKGSAPAAEQHRSRRHTRGTLTREVLKDMQFHAMGSYLSLRRITSSLQRHRRLAPLLQLHACVSGYRAAAAAAAERREETARKAGEEDEAQMVSTTARTAAQHRHRVLSGELMGVASKRVHRNSSQQQQVQQAGAMLWREVALLDAYTLITLGHVSEHAVDVASLDKAVVLRQLAWLQQECTAHLRTLAQPSHQSKEGEEDAHDSQNAEAHVADARMVRASYRLSPSRARVLLRCLTPRTRATLMDKLREGLRLSAKVLARWGEPAMICRLYLSYPEMGPSWEVGRALLQLGHYEAAVGVLESLLETPGASRVAPGSAAGSRGGSASSGSAAGSPLLSSSAGAVRQLLLEAMQGAAAGLVAQQQCHEARIATIATAACDVAELPVEAAAVAGDGHTSLLDSEADAPIPAELRAQLHTLYTRAIALPVPLPLCLHAFMQGLTEAPTPPTTTATAAAPSASSGGSGDPKGGGVVWPTAALLGRSSWLKDASPDEALRRTAVLCTYLLRCHVTEQPGRGLLSKTVELWASCVARYLCRRGHHRSTTGVAPPRASATVARLRLSTTDRYLREVTLRLFYGCPHVPVARLLLTRLLQCYHTDTGVVSPPLLDTEGGGWSRGEQQVRAAGTVQWLLSHLFRYTGAEAAESSAERLRAYPVCVPGVAQGGLGVQERWWNADGTERYALDTLRLMPRIALEGLTRVLGNAHHGEATPWHSALARVQVALRLRTADEDDQQQPWQCSTCYLWNGRFASECKRCQTLATVLLQCRSCGFYTSSAGYRATQGLGCEVCGLPLLTPHLGESDAEDSSFSSSAQQQYESISTATTVKGSATVTGTGRPASLFLPSSRVLQALPLRPWTCTHCRTANEAHHIFFCHSCGRPPATLAATRDEAPPAPAPCDACGHAVKTVEGRLLPWCERCGALRLQQEEQQQQQQRQRAPSLWWCSECAVTLNPWTRTHCSLCGAGRPAGLTAALSPSTAPASSIAHGSPVSATQPLVTVPWSMASCGACGASQRIGAGPCWRCGAAQTLPPSTQEAIAAGWRLWLTQATHAVVSTPQGNERHSEDGCGAGASTTAAAQMSRISAASPPSSPPRRSTGKLSTPLLMPRASRWLCLRENCLHLNVASTESVDGKTDETQERQRVPVSCAACGSPRRHVEVFHPYLDRFSWRAADGDPDAQPSAPLSGGAGASHPIVEALLLPRAPPHPLDVILVDDPGAAEQEGTAEYQVRVRRLQRAGPTPTCACCGAAEASDATEAAEGAPRHPRLFLVRVCSMCGHCSWGRSCNAFDRVWPASPAVRAAARLLPGEEALALRLLLRSLTETLRQALSTVETLVGGALSGGDMYDSSPPPKKRATSAPSRAGVPPLDWAWLSRHVVSAVQLIARDATAGCAESPTTVVSVTRAHTSASSSPLPHCEREASASSSARAALLPWRGCDLASPLQLCSAEPRVAVLSDAAGTLHSALRDVQVALECICRLVELRLGERAPPSSHSSVSSSSVERRRSMSGRRSSRRPAPQPLPPYLQDAWTRRLLRAALDLVDVVNESTVFDEIGFATLRRLCRLLRPHESDHIDTETKWCYLQEMKLSRSALLHGCVRCEQCLTQHAPGQPCAPL